MSMTRFLFNAIRKTGTKEIPVSQALQDGMLDSILKPGSPEYEIVQEFWSHHCHFRMSLQSFSIRLPKDGSSFPLEINFTVPLKNFFVGHYAKLMKKHHLQCGVVNEGIWFYQIPSIDWEWSDSKEPPSAAVVKFPIAPNKEVSEVIVDPQFVDIPLTWTSAGPIHTTTEWREVQETPEPTTQPVFGGQVGFEVTPESFSTLTAFFKETQDKGKAMPIIHDNPSSDAAQAPLGDATPETPADVAMVYPLGRHVGFVIPAERVREIEAVVEGLGSVTVHFGNSDKVLINVSSSNQYTFSKAVNALNRAKKKYK